MIESIVKAKLPADEELNILRNRLTGGTGKKRAAIVTGLHGDELEGQYVYFELVRRLTDRGTEDHETILARLQRASEEAEGIDCYDYLVMNDDLDTCVEQTHELIQLQHRRASKNMELINQIRKDLGNLSKGE